MSVMRSQVPCQTQIGSKEVTQRNCLKLGAHSQPPTLKGIEGYVEAPGLDQEEGQALLNYSYLHQSNQQVGQIPFGSTCNARTSHGRPWTHMTHHGLDSGEATTFPHIVFFALLRRTYIRMALFPRTPKEESRNCPGLNSQDFNNS